MQKLTEIIKKSWQETITALSRVLPPLNSGKNNDEDVSPSFYGAGGITARFTEMLRKIPGLKVEGVYRKCGLGAHVSHDEDENEEYVFFEPVDVWKDFKEECEHKEHTASFGLITSVETCRPEDFDFEKWSEYWELDGGDYGKRKYFTAYEGVGHIICIDESGRIEVTDKTDPT